MSERKRKIIYVVGLSHSGSTVLDMLLTTRGRAVGLGQVWTVLREDLDRSRTRQCSCGASATECKLWGRVLDRLSELPASASSRERYQIVLETIDRLYGPEVAVIDSSKHAEHLATMTRIPNVDVAVLHNMKDVRPFTISTLDNNARKGHDLALPEKIFYQWYRDNRASYDLAGRSLGRHPIRVMYEGLCLSTEAVAARLAANLGEDYIDVSAALNCGQTHIVSGNRLRLPETGRLKRLTYDYRWMVRREWLRPYVLMPMVRKYNEQCLREFGNAL